MPKSLYSEKKQYSITDKVIFFLYSLYFLLKPFYFWSSGIPQVSDFIAGILIAIFFFKNKKVILPSETKPYALIGFLFICYIAIINIIWALILGETSFIIITLFYLYNYIIAILVLNLYYRYKDQLIEITYKSTLFSVFIQTLLFFMSGGFTGSRMVIGFNNPNQLGYYALLTLCIMLFCSKRIQVKLVWLCAAVFSSSILVFASLSKAAIVSFIGLLFYFIFYNSSVKKVKTYIVGISIIVISLLLLDQITDIFQNNTLIQAVQTRISIIGEDKDDNLESRGYDRIFNYPEYWIFGSGEGENYRFEGNLQGSEFHSTFGNIQVSYGIIGLSLFLYLLISCLKINRFTDWYFVFFIIAYGLTHNGIRNTFFWIIMSLISVSAANKNFKK